MRYTSAVSKRVLILTPWVPYPVTGACQQDRICGLKQMKKLGYDMQVIAKIHSWQPRAEAERVFAEEGIPLTLLPYVQNLPALLWKRLPRILTNPALLDGAALEYTDPAYEQAVKDAVERFKPNVIWIEYTLLWPLLRLLKPYGVPMIMKSSLNEPANCRDENNWSFLSVIKSIPKYPGERIAARESSFIFAITPAEEKWYRHCGARHAGTLPLRGLSQCFARKNHIQKDVLDVVFLSSNYNMGHNRNALTFLLEQIIPRVRDRAPGMFRFHLTGSKFPEVYKDFLKDDVRATGFVQDIGQFMASMDIALCPWISGHGMQQKVFEPLCRSIPLITTKTAGYPFEPEREVMLADTPDEYVDHLLILHDAARRQKQADAAYNKATMLFSEETVMKTVREAIDLATIQP